MDAEVAVIGGGPAGCSAALALAAQGVSVVVVHQTLKRSRPTETALPELAQILGGLGAEEALDSCWSCQGIESNWAGHLHFRSGIANPLGSPWFVDRANFDRRLRGIAEKRGVGICAAQVNDLKFFSDRIVLRALGRMITVQSVIFASGSSALAARCTDQIPVRTDTLCCYWRLLKPESGKPPEQILSVESADYGWWYTVPSRNGLVYAGLVTDSSNARGIRAAAANAWTKLFEATELRAPLGRTSPITAVCADFSGFSYLERRSGPRWLIAGDAAAKLDPLGSTGLMAALSSGKRAAEELVGSLLGHGSQSGRLDSWYGRLIAKFRDERLAQYTAGRGHRQTSFWARRLAARVA